MHRSPCRAQDYPTRPIKIIVGFVPGGGVDTVARLVGQEMSKALGQPIVVENRAGAAGTIGATAAARSAPDGYTLVMFPGGHPLYGATYKSLPFDTVNSFEWISTIVTLQFIVLVRAESKFQSLPELIAAAKAAPETITFASAGAGSTHHLTIELIANRSGAKFLHVPYQGDAAAINALLGDQVQFTLATPDAGDRQHPGRQDARPRGDRQHENAGLAECTDRARRRLALPISTCAPGSASPAPPGYRARSWSG